MTSASSRWPACGRPARRSPGKRASASIVAPVSPGSAALSSPAASRLLPVRQDLPFPAELTDEHRDYQQELHHWRAEETGYSHIQGTKPQTLAYA